MSPNKGAAGPGRPVSAGFLEQAFAAARLCGVTRLADVTGLDRIGLPVWQAVRPAGRSLSVHQGKGASADAARLGALCEAIEAHCAEQAPADGPCCGFDDLPEAERAPEIGDYCRMRSIPLDGAESIQWCRATDLATGKPHYLPHELVSLDYTKGVPSPFERASSGLGAGVGEAEALSVSLLELIERDAVGQWQRLDRSARARSAVRAETVSFAWFQWWRDRLRSLDIELQLFRIEALAGISAFMCMIGAVEEFGPAYRRFYGTAADGDPELALFKAFAEAIQSRLTLIAGVRDDILPSYYRRETRRPQGDSSLAAQPWQPVEPAASTPGALADGLAALGYPQIAFKRLDEGLAGIAVTKAFVPGLGSARRTRRAAL